MSRKLCVLAYCPPPNIAGSEAFLANLRKFRTENDLIIYSDHPYPDVIQLRQSPEGVKGSKYTDGRPNKWAINNLVFLTGLRMASDRGYTHFIYVEADCRVGQDFWDREVFTEFFAHDPEPILGGTVASYNACNLDMTFTKAWNRFIAKNVDSRFPITAFGGNGAADKQEPAIFPNGALAVYSVEWLKTHFPLSGTVTAATTMTAFDYECGRWLVRDFGLQTFEKLVHLESVYSSYGDVQTTEDIRRDLLLSGKVVAVHQIKSIWPGPERNPDPVDLEPIKEPVLLGVDPAEPGSDKTVVLEVTECSGCGAKIPAGSEYCGQCEGDLAQSPVSISAPSNEGQIMDKVTVEPPPSPEKLKQIFAEPSKTDPAPAVAVLDTGVEIFIVSYAPDIPYLHYCLKSIEKFCRGFSGVTLLVPEHDERRFVDEIISAYPTTRLKTYKVPADTKLWHIAHQLEKVHADVHCPEAKFILNTDSDCIFTQPTSPDVYFRDGKPILCIEPFHMIKNNPWQPVIMKAMGICPNYESMRRHGAIHYREVYEAFRRFMSSLHEQDIREWWMKQKADFPWGVTEFNFLGTFVGQVRASQYALVDLANEAAPTNPIFQFWSKSPINRRQDFPGGGSGTPLAKLKFFGLA